MGETPMPRNSTNVDYTSQERDFEKQLQFLGNQLGQVGCAAGVAPLVVVPGNHFHQVAGNDLTQGRIHGRRSRVTLEVDGN